MTVNRAELQPVETSGVNVIINALKELVCILQTTRCQNPIVLERENLKILARICYYFEVFSF